MPIKELVVFLRDHKNENVGIIQDRIIDYLQRYGYARSLGETVAHAYLQDIRYSEKVGDFPRMAKAWSSLPVQY